MRYLWTRVCILGCLLASVLHPAFGQERTLLRQDHPRVFFTSDDLPRIRQAEFAADELLGLTEHTLGYFGGKKVTFPLPPVQPGKIEEPPGFDAKSYGHYPYWTGYSGRLEGELYKLALSYASTGNEAFAQRAREWILSLIEWDVWTDPDYHPNLTPCLDTGHITLGVAVAYDVCYDQFTPEERRRIVRQVDKLGLQSMYSWVFGDKQQQSEFNLEILLNASLGIGALAFLGELDDQRAWQYIDQAKAYFMRLVDKKLDSPNTEGLSYSSSLDHGSRFADVLKRVTGDDEYFRHPYVGEVVPRWIAYFLGPNRSRCVNFCDGGYPAPFITTLKLLSNNYDNSVAGWLLEQFGATDGNDFDGIVYGNPDRASAPPPAAWPNSAVFENIGWAALRTGWDDDDTLVAFKCSSSKEGHDHTEQGNIVVNVAGTWIATDPGYGSFRSKPEGVYSRGTAGHNSILVDGTMQTAREGKITRFFTSEELDYAVGDASRCYDPGKLSKFVRHVIFVKPDYLVVWDELASEGTPRSFQWLLHTDAGGWFEIDGKTPDAGFSGPASEIKLVKDRASLNARFLAPTEVTATYDFWPETEKNYPAFASVEAPKAAMQNYVVAMVPRRLNRLLVNAGFERGAAGWTPGGEPGSQAQGSVDATVARTGKQSVKLVGEKPERDRLLYGQWYMPAVGGATYRASVWCKTEDLAGGHPVIDLTFYDGARKYAAPGMFVARGEDGTHDWQQLVIEAQAPQGARLMTFRAGLNRAAGTLWFDDARLHRIDPTAPKAADTAQAPWQFSVEGTPGEGAFAIIATAGDRRDTLVINPSGDEVSVAGVTTRAPAALLRQDREAGLQREVRW